MVHPVRAAALATALVVMPLSSVLAAGDAREGRQIAERWCSSCHMIGRDTRGGDAAPPFVALASDPARTETFLRNWISNPHPPMPNLNLSRQDVEDLSAYIRSLNPAEGRSLPHRN